MRKKDLKVRHYIIGRVNHKVAILGHCSSVDNATRASIVLDGIPCSFHTDLYNSLDAEDFWTLYEDVMGVKLSRQLITNQMAIDLWDKLEVTKIPHLIKPGAKKVLRELYSYPGMSWSKEELMMFVAGGKWDTIRTGMSDMKFKIKKVRGQYVRQ